MDCKLLEMCLEKANSILTVLNNQDPVVVAEYVKTVNSVSTVLKRLSTTKKMVKVDVKALDNIYVILTEYETRIYARKGADGLKKLLESSRTRKRVDQINASLFANLRQFLLRLKDLNTSRGSIRTSKKKKVGGKAGNSGGKRFCGNRTNRGKKHDGEPSKPKREGKGSALEGQAFAKSKNTKKRNGEKSGEAKRKKGRQKKAANKASSTRSKPKAGANKNDADNGCLRGGDRLGSTTPIVLRETTDSIIASSVLNVDESYSTSTSCLSSESSDEGDGLGMFDMSLVGDASSDPWWNETFSTYLVAFDDLLEALAMEIGVDDIDTEDADLLRSVVDDSNTGHVPATNWGEFLKAFGPLEKVFDNVKSVLSADWFHKYLSGVEAERILADKDVGTFLIRFSMSSAGNFALAFVHAPKVVVQILISSSPEGGFLVLQQETGEYTHFATFWDIVDFYEMFLKVPLTDDLFKQPWFHGNLSSAEAAEVLKFELPGVYLIRWSSRPNCYACTYIDDDGAVHQSLIEQQGGGRVKFSNNLEVFESMAHLIEAYGNILHQPYQSKSLGADVISRMKLCQERPEK